MPPPSKKRKTNPNEPQEITFDFAAREEYLTGFHKRKQARIKHAQEENAKREKEERTRLRREVRFASLFRGYTNRLLNHFFRTKSSPKLLSPMQPP